MRTRTVRSVIYLGAGAGLLVALFAGAEFVDASLRTVCSVNGFFSCSVVDQSGKTTTLGIQDYLWGIGGFIVILIVAGIAEKRPRDTTLAYALLGLTSVGAALSVYFVYVSVVEIGALCPVCLTSYLLGGVAWVGAIVLARKTRAKAARGGERTGKAPPTPAA
jgi:uncharacterized membrane protein